MKPELLSICIPTFNRAKCLDELLGSIANQIQTFNLDAHDIKVYVSDNASPDSTPDVFRKWAPSLPGAIYSRNQNNIGANANIIHVRTLGRGRYTWVLGDDDLLCDGALPKLINTLKADNIGLLIAYHSKYELNIPLPHRSANYREFAHVCSQCNPHALAEHTLISSNIYRSDCFDYEIVHECLDSVKGNLFGYPHMFGLLRPLNKLGLPIVVPDYPIIRLQRLRTSTRDNSWSDMDAAWIQYFTWMKTELDIPELDPTAPSRIAQRHMLRRILSNPLFFLWSYRWELLSPQAYRFFFRRLLLLTVKQAQENNHLTHLSQTDT